MRLSYKFHLFVLVFPTISNCSIVLSNGPKQLTKHLPTKTTGEVSTFFVNLFSIYFCIFKNCAPVKILYLYIRRCHQYFVWFLTQNFVWFLLKLWVVILQIAELFLIFCKFFRLFEPLEFHFSQIWHGSILSNCRCDKILRKSCSFWSLLGFNTISFPVYIYTYICIVE